MKFYISSSCSTGNYLPEIVRELIDLGFRAIELTGNVGYCEDMGRLILHYKEKYGLDFLIHNYLPIEKEAMVLNLASTDPDVKRKSLSVVDHAISLSRELGNGLYTLHPGFTHDLTPTMVDGFFVKTNTRNKREDFYSMVRDISSKMNGADFRIAVENLSPKNADERYSYLCTPEDILGFLNHFEDMPTVGLLLDLGHLNVSSSILNFDKFVILDALFAQYSEKIFEIHISDNDGARDSHRVTEPDSWQVTFLREHRDSLRDKALVFEWQNSASEETFKRYEMITNRLASS